MKRMFTFISLYLLFVVLAFCALASLTLGVAKSEPFLWAGATPNATKWEINLDGVIIETKVSHTENETAWLKYDLVGITNGAHFVEVRAGNLWGWSAWYPLAFTKATADVLINPYIDI